MTTDYDALMENLNAFWTFPMSEPNHSVNERERAEAAQAIAELRAEIERLREYVADQTERGDDWFDSADAAEKEVERLRAALELATSLFNDTGYLQRKADYARGHLSYHNSIAEQEAPIRKALEGEKS